MGFRRRAPMDLRCFGGTFQGSAAFPADFRWKRSAALSSELMLLLLLLTATATATATATTTTTTNNNNNNNNDIIINDNTTAT